MTQSQPLSTTNTKSSSIIIGVAVVGKSNEPLYLCDCERLRVDAQNITPNDSSNDDIANVQTTVDDNQDPFGFIEQSSQHLEQRNSMSLFCQILIHAALDNLEEKIERPSGKNGQMPVIIRNNNTVSVTKNDPLQWLGLLIDPSTSDGYAVYGYITATNIKLMVITRDLIIPTNPIIVKGLQNFLQEVHQHYIMYLLNPFCDTRGGSIRSKQFDIRMTTSIQKIQRLNVN